MQWTGRQRSEESIIPLDRLTERLEESIVPLCYLPWEVEGAEVGGWKALDKSVIVERDPAVVAAAAADTGIGSLIFFWWSYCIKM